MSTHLQAYDKIMEDEDLLVTDGGRVKNGFLQSFAAPGGYRDLKINPILRGMGMVCEVFVSVLVAVLVFTFFFNFCSPLFIRYR